MRGGGGGESEGEKGGRGKTGTDRFEERNGGRKGGRMWIKCGKEGFQGSKASEKEKGGDLKEGGIFKEGRGRTDFKKGRIPRKEGRKDFKGGKFSRKGGFQRRNDFKKGGRIAYLYNEAYHKHNEEESLCHKERKEGRKEGSQ
jgi:hypothetical protein